MTAGGEARAASGAPVFENVNAKLAALERRMERLQDNIASKRGSDAALSYDKAELAAIKAGHGALRYYRAELEGEDTSRLALAELLDALSGRAANETAIGARAASDRVAEAVKRARLVLAECE